VSKRTVDIDNLSTIQQVLLAAVLLVTALFVGSILFLIFAIPNNWLTPTPRNMYERNIIVAQNTVAEVKRDFGTGATADGSTPYADAEAQLIIARLEAGQLTRALKDAKKLHDRYPDHLAITYGYARALFESELYDEAQVLVSKLIDRVPSHPSELLRGVQYLQAQLFIYQQRGDEAFALLMKAAAIQPAFAEYYQEAGECAYADKNWEKAAQAYASVLAFDPESKEAWSKLEEISRTDPEAFERGVRAAYQGTGVHVGEMLQ